MQPCGETMNIYMDITNLDNSIVSGPQETTDTHEMVTGIQEGITA